MLRLHQHQKEAIEAARTGKSYVLTTGTGSGKSLAYIIPIVNIVIHLIVSLDVARNFGKGGAFGVFGVWLFSFIGIPILGFGSAQYQGPRPQQQF